MLCYDGCVSKEKVMRSRYIQNRILNYLSDEKRHTISEIANDLEVSYKTVQSHIADLSIDYQIITYYGGVCGGVELLNNNVQLVLTKIEVELIKKGLKSLENDVKTSLLIAKMENYRKEIKNEGWNFYSKGER